MPVIGPFNRRVLLERRVQTQDEFGQPIEQWVLARTVWAHRSDMTGDERFRAQQELATRVSKFTIRWFAELNAGDWRINHEALVWDIIGLAEPEKTRRMYWEITAAAVGA